jgi:hypothetical protein
MPMKNENILLYKLFDKKENKSWELKYNILIIRREDWNILKIIDKFKSRIKIIHFSKYLPKEFVSTIISYCLNLVGKTPIAFQTANWIYIHLPKSIKSCFILKQIRYGKLRKMVKDVKQYYLQGIDFVEIRQKVMIKHKIRKISVKTIIKLAYISYYLGVDMAVKWLKWFIRKINNERIAKFVAWSGKPPPSNFLDFFCIVYNK